MKRDNELTQVSLSPFANAVLRQGKAWGVASQAANDLLATAAHQKEQRIWLMLLSLCFAVPLALIAAFPGSPISILSYLFTVFLVAFIGGIFALRSRRTTQSLAQIEDIRMIGPLIDRLGFERKRVRTRRAIRQALMRLLPLLKASDARLLTPEQKGRLTRHLAHLSQSRRDKEFQVVILRALEQVGDAQAIPVVEKMAWKQPVWAAQPQVHTVAMECLPYLRQHAEAETARQTLLRAASQGTEGSDELLRPAEGAGVVNPDELLRADLSQESKSR